MTPNQQRFVEKFPHLAGRVTGELPGEAREARPPRLPLPVCLHRGPKIDETKCRCSVYVCKLHGTCSTSPRAGLRVCKDCTDHTSGGQNATDQ